MKCRSLFSCKNHGLSSAEFAKRAVMVNITLSYKHRKSSVTAEVHKHKPVLSYCLTILQIGSVFYNERKWYVPTVLL